MCFLIKSYHTRVMRNFDEDKIHRFWKILIFIQVLTLFILFSRRKMLMDIEDAVFSGSTGVGTGASLRVESKDFKVESFEEDSLTVNFQDVMKKSLQEESQYDYESLSRSRFSSRVSCD